MKIGKLEDYVEELSQSTRYFYKNEQRMEEELLPGILKVFVSFTVTPG